MVGNFFTFVAAKRKKEGEKEKEKKKKEEGEKRRGEKREKQGEQRRGFQAGAASTKHCWASKCTNLKCLKVKCQVSGHQSGFAKLKGSFACWLPWHQDCGAAGLHTASFHHLSAAWLHRCHSSRKEAGSDLSFTVSLFNTSLLPAACCLALPSQQFPLGQRWLAMKHWQGVELQNSADDWFLSSRTCWPAGCVLLDPQLPLGAASCRAFLLVAASSAPCSKARRSSNRK